MTCDICKKEKCPGVSRCKDRGKDSKRDTMVQCHGNCYKTEEASLKCDVMVPEEDSHKEFPCGGEIESKGSFPLLGGDDAELRQCKKCKNAEIWS